MSGKADYTDDEWAALRRAPMVAGMAVSFADPGGPIEITKETMAAQRATAAPPGDDELLIALSQDAMANQREITKNLKSDLGLKAATVREQIAAELTRVNDIVSAKATDSEAAAFRQWLLEAAQDAANAAKEGGFMGIGAVRVSEGEERMLAQMRQILGLPEA